MFINKIKALLLGTLMLSSTAFSNPTGYVQTISVDEEVTAKYIQGELRWCENKNLKGMVCKGWWGLQDWWDAKSYVHYKTGHPDATILEVSVSEYGILIKFR